MLDQPLSMFGVHRQKKDGLRAWCKSCNRADARRWSKENPDKKTRGRIVWKQNNPAAFKIIAKRSAEKNRETRLPKQRELAKRQAVALTDNYVKTALGVDRYLVTADLIELKRVHLKLHRLLAERECLVEGSAGKRCTVCHFEKRLSSFSVRTLSSDGLSSRCKECDKVKNKEAYEKHKAKIKEAVRAQQIKSTDRIDDYYLRRLLKKDLTPRTPIPQCLLDVKRVQIQIQRQLKEMK